MSIRSERENALRKEIAQYVEVGTIARSAPNGSKLISAESIGVLFDSGRLVIFAKESGSKGRGVRLQVNLDYGLLARLVDIIAAPDTHDAP